MNPHVRRFVMRSPDESRLFPLSRAAVLAAGIILPAALLVYGADAEMPAPVHRFRALIQAPFQLSDKAAAADLR